MKCCSTFFALHCALFVMSSHGYAEVVTYGTDDAAPPPTPPLDLPWFQPEDTITFPAFGVDRARALDCLTSAVYYEAATEPTLGQEAVAQVVLNRVKQPNYPKSVCGVVYQGSTRRTGCQFTFTCDGSLARLPVNALWQKAERVASRALDGKFEIDLGPITHYHTYWVNPYWSSSLVEVARIGAHVFYQKSGSQPVQKIVSITEEPAPTLTRRSTRHHHISNPLPQKISSIFSTWGIDVASIAIKNGALAVHPPATKPESK